MVVDILSAGWLIAKRTSLTADNATNIIQEGRIYHRKRKLPLINACRWEQLQCCSKAIAIPTRGNISCESKWQLGWTAWIYTDTMSSWKIIKKGNRCSVSTLPDSTKTFWSDKKTNFQEPPVTFKIGVERTKLVDCFSLEKKKKKSKKHHCRKSKNNSVLSSGKRGVELEKEEDEEYSALIKLTQSMRLQSELCWQRLSFTYHWLGNSLPAEHFIQAIYWERKKWHDSNSTLEFVHNHMLPAMVAQCMVTARLHHGCRQEPGMTQTKGHQVPKHKYLLRYANHSWKLSAEWWIFPSAPIWALVSDRRYPRQKGSLRSFQPVACPINSASTPTKFNTVCPPPDPSAFSFIHGPSLLHCNSWRPTHIVTGWAFHGYDFSLSWIRFFLGVGTSRWRLSA